MERLFGEPKILRGEKKQPWSRVLAYLGFVLAFGINGSLPAMTEPVVQPICTVTGPVKFVERAGGADALCRQVVSAVGSRAPGKHRIELGVTSGTHMTATIHLADGRTLPTLHTGVSDGTINRGVVDRFAQEIANQISRTLTPQH